VNLKHRLIFIFALLFFAVPSLAFAHAHLIKSSPAKDSIVHSVPSDVVLNFSEDLELAMCKMQVKDLKTGKVVSQGKPENADGKKNSLKVELEPLKNEKAKYEVSWKAVSTDSHRMPGKFTFSYEPLAK
jgi:methionine-rich copper-binding protein CopC